MQKKKKTEGPDLIPNQAISTSSCNFRGEIKKGTAVLEGPEKGSVQKKKERGIHKRVGRKERVFLTPDSDWLAPTKKIRVGSPC